MPKLLKKILLTAAIFGSFYLAGHLTMYIESWHESIVASTAIFGVSFVSLLGIIAKIWVDITGW